MSDIRVIKLGGSLLELPDWPPRFADWLRRELPAANVLIVGGGELADVIRRYDERFSLEEETAHWLCVRAMSLHAEMVAELLGREMGRVSLARDYWALAKLAVGELAVLDAAPFLSDIEPERPGAVLPHDWSVTSDSIAARVAECLEAEELVLLKSTLPPDDARNGATGYVDGHFGKAAAGLPKVRFVDLRRDAANSARPAAPTAVE